MENVITLVKLIGLLLFCPLLLSLSLYIFFNSKNTRNGLARPVMGIIFLVIYVSVCLPCPKMRRRNYVAQTHAYSKSDLSG